MFYHCRPQKPNEIYINPFWKFLIYHQNGPYPNNGLPISSIKLYVEQECCHAFLIVSFGLLALHLQ